MHNPSLFLKYLLLVFIGVFILIGLIYIQRSNFFNNQDKASSPSESKKVGEEIIQSLTAPAIPPGEARKVPKEVLQQLTAPTSSVKPRSSDTTIPSPPPPPRIPEEILKSLTAPSK